MIKMRIDTRQWHDTGAELRRFKNMDVPQFVRYRARIVVQDLIKFTPPRGKNPGSESFRSQKKRGEKTIRRDVGRVFKALEQLQINQHPREQKLAQAFGKAIAARDGATLEILMRRCGIKFRAILSECSESIHREARNLRGIVAKAQGWFVFTQAQIDQFVAKLLPDVGKAKSGWGAAALWLQVPSRHWPAWVKRHGANGAIEDRTGNVSRPTILMTNDRPEVGEMDSEEIVGAVLRINDNKMRMELEAIWAHERRKASIYH